MPKLLALVGPRFPDRLRGFLLTIIVVDDVVALLVIAFVYSGSIDMVALLIAIAIFALMPAILATGFRYGPFYFVLALAAVVLFLLYSRRQWDGYAARMIRFQERPK